jgi:ribonucleoside-diphosphate reductase alpha chain
VALVASLPGVDLGDDVRWMLDEGVHFSPVTSVEDAGAAEVFDLSVPGPEAFVGNGIINHNTVNLPNSATVDDVRGAHELSYALGVKCVAIYRDGSKLSQPLNSAKSGADDLDDVEDRRVLPVEITPGMSPTQFYGGNTPPRFRLPAMRPGVTWRIEVGGEEVYITTGEYVDGAGPGATGGPGSANTLGEVFLSLGKDGSTLRGFASALSIAISQGLQHGVPLEAFVKAYKGQTFEPRGVVTGHEHLKMSSSIVDALVKTLSLYYLGDETGMQVKGQPVHFDAIERAPVTEGTTPATPVGDGDVTETPKPTGERLYGKACSNCGGSNLISAGSCAVCGDCGTTTGCS